MAPRLELERASTARASSSLAASGISAKAPMSATAYSCSPFWAELGVIPAYVTKLVADGKPRRQAPIHPRQAR